MRAIANIDPHARIARESIANGGGTFSPHVGRSINLNGKFVVAVSPEFEHKVQLSGCEVSDRVMLRREIERYVEDHRREWLKDGYALGTWIEEEDGVQVVYLDVVERFDNYDDAYLAAVERKQIAFFDGSKGESVYVAPKHAPASV